MSSVFDVTVDDGGVVSRIRAMIAAGDNMRPLYQRIGAALVSEIQLGFKAGASPYGQAWAPLSIRRGQPLRDSGRLRSSITSRPDDSGVTVGTNLIYAPVHQFGATIKPKNAKRLVFPGGGGLIFAKSVTIPARPFMPLDDSGAVNLPHRYQSAIAAVIAAHFANTQEG